MTASVKHIAVFTAERWDSAVVYLRIRSPLQAAGIEVLRGYSDTSASPDLACIGQVDGVLVQRDFPRHADAYQAVVATARHQHKPVVYETDDLMWDMPPDHPVYERYKAHHDVLTQAVFDADVVTTTTTTLANRLRAMNPNTLVLPNCIDPHLWRVASKPSPLGGEGWVRGSGVKGWGLVMGYMGSGTHGPDLRMVAPALREVLVKYRDRVSFELLNEQLPPELAQLPNVRRFDGTPDYAAYARQFTDRTWDIGIAPLQDTAFNRAKSALKYLEFSAMGAACVFSDVAPFRETVTQGETGLLATTTEEWTRSLSQLIEDAALRERIAANAQADLKAHWMVGGNAHLWQEAYETTTPPPTPPLEGRGANLPSVSVIVLTHNGKHHLDECFASLHRQDYPPDKLELVLADNASTDGAPNYAREKFPRVKVFEVGSNAGFCAAYNRAIAASTADYVALLNDDMRVEPDWLIQLVRAVQSEPDIVCAGSKILTWDGTAIDFAGHAYSPLGYATGVGFGETDVNAHDDQHYLLAASGGAMLIRRDTFLNFGGFDESYVSYFEDLDLGWRLWAAGYKTVFAPKSVAYHKHFSTSARIPKPSIAHLYERNTLFTLIKNADQPFFERALLPAILMRVKLAYLNAVNAGLRFDQIRLKSGQSLPNQKQNVTTYDTTYYAREAAQVLRTDGPLGLARKVVDELGRRSGKPIAQPSRASDLPGQDAFWHEQAVIAAINDVIERYDVLMAERAKLQARRKVSDEHIFALTKAITLRPWFTDPAYERSHRMLLSCFGLDAWAANLSSNPVSPLEGRL